MANAAVSPAITIGTFHPLRRIRSQIKPRKIVSSLIAVAEVRRVAWISPLPRCRAIPAARSAAPTITAAVMYCHGGTAKSRKMFGDQMRTGATSTPQRIICAIVVAQPADKRGYTMRTPMTATVTAQTSSPTACVNTRPDIIFIFQDRSPAQIAVADEPGEVSRA